MKKLITIILILAVLLPTMAMSEDYSSKSFEELIDINKIILDSDADIPALKGWRKELFGQKALDFKNGKIALSFNPKTHTAEWIAVKSK